MQAIATSMSAFSARATRGRKIPLLAYSALITVVMLGLAELIAVRAAEDGTTISVMGLADMFAMMLVGGALFVVAPAMVASNVAEERRSGTLDLLRTAPISPTALTAGFLVGAPGAMYWLCAGPLALHVVAGLTGVIPLGVLVSSLFIIPLGAIAAMLISILLAISVGREGGGAAPLIVAGLLTFGTFVTLGMAAQPSSLPWAYVHPAGALSAIYQSFDGPFRDAFSSSWRLEQMNEPPLAALLIVEPFFAVLVYGLACLLLLGAARRILATDVTSRLTKKSALALFSLAAVAIAVPMRMLVPTDELRHDTIGVYLFALLVPYVACVLGATSGAGARIRAGRMQADGAPHLVSLLMAGVTLGLLGLLYGSRPLRLLMERDAAITVGMFCAALTLPIFALWAATRLHTNAGRLAFWALISVHLCLLVPSIVTVGATYNYPHNHDVMFLLTQIDVAFGALLPLVLVWRQRVADRRLATV